MREEFALAELMWEVADSCLSDTERSTMCVALNASESVHVILASVRALVRRRIPLPRNLFDEFHEWFVTSPPLDPCDPWMPVWLELHLAAMDLRCADYTMELGGYGRETLCYFILDDAGAADAPHGKQAEVLRQWLGAHRPSPALRADLVSSGFGYLLDGWRRPSSDDSGLRGEALE